MSRLTLLILSTGIFNLATAEVCTQIADDEERLACFDATRACAAIGSDTGRIDCFDSAYSGAGSSDIRVGDANVPEHLPVASDSAVDQSTPEGLADDDKTPDAAMRSASYEELSEERAFDARDENVEATIIEVATSALKIDFLRLDNGQVWRETENSRTRFKAGQKVGIQEGIFGSHNLTIEGSDKIVKVTRVK